MPKLPVVSGAEAIRALERLGFVVVGQRGSHLAIRRGSMDGLRCAQLPRVEAGTLAGLVRARSNW